MYCCEEVPCGLVVPCCDGAVLLEAAEEVLRQVAPCVEVPVDLAPFLAVPCGWDHDLHVACGERCDHALLRIVGLVRDDRLGVPRGVRKQGVGAFEVVRLPRGEMEAGRVAEGVARRVDLGAQPSPAPADALLRRVPPFAPAEC